MNIVIEQMLNRRSIRAFTEATVAQKDLDLILKAAQQSPTSINGQQISLIVTRDKETIKKIADIAGGQPQVLKANTFITIVVDFNRTTNAAELANQNHIIERSAEGLVVGGVDAGIMLNAVQTAANALGYGTTAIGGIRNDPQAMIELLALPKRTYPIVGLTLGVTDKENEPAIKPRVPLETFAMYEQYDTALVKEGVQSYDQTLQNWWEKQGLADMPSYSREIAGFYSKVYFPKVAQTLKSQGFGFGDGESTS